MFRTVPLSIIRSFSLYTAMVYVIQVLLSACKQDQDGTPIPSWSCSQNLYDINHCCVYSEKLLMMDRGTVQNMYSFIPKINLRISGSSWFYYKNTANCFNTDYSPHHQYAQWKYCHQNWYQSVPRRTREGMSRRVLAAYEKERHLQYKYKLHLKHRNW